MRPAIIIGGLFHGRSQRPHQNRVTPQLVASAFCRGGWFRCVAAIIVALLFGIFSQVFRIDELRAGVHEGHGCFALAEAKDR